MNICLILPPIQVAHKVDIYHPQSLGLLSIAALLSRNDHQVHFIDAVGEGRGSILKKGKLYRVGLKLQQIVNAIPESCQLIGVSANFLHDAGLIHELVQALEDQYPSTPIVLGGLYPSTLPHFARSSLADYIVLGEGEESLLSLIDYLEKGTALPTSVIDINDYDQATNYAPAFVQDLNSLPFPQRTLTPFEKVVASSPLASNKRSALVSSSRGCPFDCTFCSIHPSGGYQLRSRSAESVLEEIKVLVKQYQVNHIYFTDDNFTLNRERAVEILKGIKSMSSKSDISWGHMALMAHSIDEDLFRLFAESNCSNVGLALEHGDPAILKSMNKKIDPSKALQLISWAHKYDIPINLGIIVGYPGEDIKAFTSTQEYCRQIRRINPQATFNFMIAQPYPGTKLFKQCKEANSLPPNFCQRPQDIPLMDPRRTSFIQTKDFTSQDVLLRKKKLISEFYTPYQKIEEYIFPYMPYGLFTLLRSIYRKIRSR